MHFPGYRTALAALVLVIVAACGGGGSGSDDSPPESGATPPPDHQPEAQALAGAIDATAQGAVICLDTNRNLACDPSEPSATVAVDGGYRLEVPASQPLDEGILVAEFPADSSFGETASLPASPAEKFALPFPASEPTRPSVIGALTALELQANPAIGAAQARRQVAERLGIAPAGAGSEPAIARLEAEALPALRRASQAALQAQSRPADQDSRMQALRTAVDGLAEVLVKYIDPASGALWPQVSAQTLVSETVGRVAPMACSFAPLEKMTIDVDGGDPVFHAADAANNYGKDTYHDATIRIEPGAAHPGGLEIRSEIKGRGNSTWQYFPKKPYRLKLAKPGQALLGMPSARNWALLANYSDKTQLRNAVALCLGEQLGMRYTIRSRFVELTFNGDYQGVYQLAEHKEAAPDRVELGADGPQEDAFDPAAGYLAEMDSRLPDEDADPWFRSSLDRPYAIKSDTVSDKAQYVGQQRAYSGLLAQIVDSVAAEINAMEAAFTNPDPIQRIALAGQRVDLESLVDFYLVNEFMRSVDGMWSSFFVYRPRGERIIFGPLWDFDLSSGNDDGTNGPVELQDRNWCPQGWWTRDVGADYLGPLLATPEFRRLVAARWQFLATRLPDLHAFIDHARVTMAAAQDRNFNRWPILDSAVWPNWVTMGSYAGEVDYLEQWLDARAQWLSAHIADGSDATPGCSAWKTRWQAYVQTP